MGTELCMPFPLKTHIGWAASQKIYWLLLLHPFLKGKHWNCPIPDNSQQEALVTMEHVTKFHLNLIRKRRKSIALAKELQRLLPV